MLNRHIKYEQIQSFLHTFIPPCAYTHTHTHTHTHIKSGNFGPKKWIANRFVAFENLSKGNNITSDQQNLRQKWDPLSVNHSTQIHLSESHKLR